MTSETSLAFAPLEARATARAPSRDRITLRDLLRDVDIGAFQEERGVAQRLRFSIVVEIAPLRAAHDDDVDRILSYDTITEAVDHVLADARLSLLETLADRIAAQILAQPLAERVFLRIEKLDRGDFTLGVEIERTGTGDAALEPVAPYAPPLVVALSHAQIADQRLAAWLDQLQEFGHPLLLTVDLPGTAVPEAASSAAQRRVNLLAMDQMAWILADLDQRCVVVDSRTELAHILSGPGIAVWAPSRLVLDASHPPSASVPDLAAWIGAETGALAVLDPGRIDMKTGRLDLTEVPRTSSDD